MWTLMNVETELNDLFCPKTIPIAWMSGNKDFRLVQKFEMVGAEIEKFKQFKNQQVIAASKKFW